MAVAGGRYKVLQMLTDLFVYQFFSVKRHFQEMRSTL